MLQEVDDEDEDEGEGEGEGEGEAEALLGEDPVYNLPPSVDLNKIIAGRSTDSLMLLNDAPLEVRKGFNSVNIPSEKIALTLVLILTKDPLKNKKIIDDGLKAFVGIAVDIGWKWIYVGASMRSTQLGMVRLDRSIPTKGVQLGRGLPAPPETPPRPAIHTLSLTACLTALCQRAKQEDITLHGLQPPLGHLAAEHRVV